MQTLRAGVPVLVVGPAKDGGTAALGRGAVIFCAVGDDWRVEFTRQVTWGHLCGRPVITSRANFPPSSLMCEAI